MINKEDSVRKSNLSKVHVLDISKKSKPDNKSRKHGLNSNKEGSVRNINGKVYVDFIYLLRLPFDNHVQEEIFKEKL